MKFIFTAVIPCKQEDIILVLRKTDSKKASVETFEPYQKHIHTEFMLQNHTNVAADFDEIYKAAKAQINYHNTLKDPYKLREAVMDFLEKFYP